MFGVPQQGLTHLHIIFLHILDATKLVYVEPISLKPTLHNKKVRIIGISKCIDRFLITKQALLKFDKVRFCIDIGGALDHNLIFL